MERGVATAISSRVQTLPEGFEGVFKMMARVLSVTAASSSAMSNDQSGCRVGTNIKTDNDRLRRCRKRCVALHDEAAVLVSPEERREMQGGHLPESMALM